MRACTRVLLVGTLAAVVSASSASAQDAGSFGVSMGHPTGVGVVWQITDRIAVRPELDLFIGGASTGVSLGFGDPSGAITSSSSSSNLHTIGYGLSALFTVYREENLSVYVAPQYLHFSTKSEHVQEYTIFGMPQRETTENSSSGHTVSGSLGARYRLGNRFGVFGEVGLSRDWEDVTSPIFPSMTEGGYSNYELRSGVGVVLWF